MGEIADMMLDGTLCQVCGEYMGESAGYPVTCPACSGDTDQYTATKRQKERCPICGKRTYNAKQHMKDAHNKEIE